MSADASALSRAQPVGVFEETNLHWYLAGQLVSVVGSLLQGAVISLLIIDVVGKVDAAYWVGVVGALTLGPATLFAPLTGLLLDRYDTKRVLFATTALGFAQAVAFAYLVYAHCASIFTINLLALCTGLIIAIDAPGRNVFIKEIVGRHNVRFAAMVFLALGNIAQVVGPGAAGFLVWYCGYPFTFVMNSLTFVVFMVVLLMIRLPQQESVLPAVDVSRPSVSGSLAAGAAYILRHTGLTTCIALTGIISTFGFSYLSLLAVIGRDMFGGGPVLFSYLAMWAGMGAVPAVGIAVVFHKFFSPRALVVSGVLIIGVAFVLLARTSDVRYAEALLFCTGYGFTVSLITVRSAITHLTRQDLVGVVTGYSYTFSCGGMVLGSWGAGIVANRLGCPAELTLCGVTLVLVAVGTYFLPGIRMLNKKAT